MRRVLLTGASAGIGLATARHLVEAGYEVWGASRDVTRLPVVAGFHAVAMDLAQPESVASGYAAAVAEAGAFDVLINNAGDGLFGPLEHLPPAEVRSQFETLVFGPLELIRLALPGMRARGGGTIINVTSLAGRLPIPFMAPYNAAKSALSALSATLALELAGSGVRVIDLEPGDIATAFNDRMRRGAKLDGYELQIASTAKMLAREMAAAPPPAIVAEAIVRALSAPSPRVTVGGFFQARLATLAGRLFPQRVLLWGIARHYGLMSRFRKTSQASVTSATLIASSSALFFIKAIHGICGS